MSDQTEFTPVPKPHDSVQDFEGKTIVNNTALQPDTDAIEGILSHLPEVVAESKAGYKTTEFWLAIVISALTVLDGIPLPEKFEGFVVAGVGIAYALSRGLAKKGVPVYESTTKVTAPTA